MSIEKFYGKWVMNREKAHYEVGAPPQSGSYIISPKDAALEFVMEWVDANGQAFHQTYMTVPDGQDYPYDNPQVVDTINTRLVDENTLETLSKKGGTVLMVGQRTLSADGKTMSIVVSGNAPNGTPYKNFSVYEKE